MEIKPHQRHMKLYYILYTTEDIPKCTTEQVGLQEGAVSWETTVSLKHINSVSVSGSL